MKIYVHVRTRAHATLRLKAVANFTLHICRDPIKMFRTGYFVNHSNAKLCLYETRKLMFEQNEMKCTQSEYPIMSYSLKCINILSCRRNNKRTGRRIEGFHNYCESQEMKTVVFAEAFRIISLSVI